jgi:hypothetical protein
MTLLVCGLAFAGDHAHGEGQVCHHPEAPAAAPDDAATIRRGEPLKGAPSVALADILKSPDRHAGKTIRVEAKVRKACLKKGCWLELAAQDKGEGVRVTFKDYGFFVPLDSAGRMAIVEGQIKVAELSEKTAQHYESEGGTVARTSQGKPREIQMVATAVELRK